MSLLSQERLALLQNISEEHQVLQTHVQMFQSWLLSKTRDLTDLMEQDQAADTKLQALQVGFWSLQVHVVRDVCVRTTKTAYLCLV